MPYRDDYGVVADFGVVKLLSELLFGKPRLAIRPLRLSPSTTHIDPRSSSVNLTTEAKGHASYRGHGRRSESTGASVACACRARAAQ